MQLPQLINFNSEIRGLHVYIPYVYKDTRGENGEIYDPIKYYEKEFKLFSYSRSTKGVIRGLHGDLLNTKLIQCLVGEIQFFVIDMRPDSPTYLNSKEFILSEENRIQVIVPAGVVNGHTCLSEKCLFYYQWSHGYVPIEQQIHVKWNDPRFKDKVNWATKNPILSDRDK
jgi:dTDP-4-dehydrorhamnose 3,5-epimerase